MFSFSRLVVITSLVTCCVVSNGARALAGSIAQQKINASDVASGDYFGSSVSVSGEIAVVGAEQRDCDAGRWCGAAYIYRFNGTSWVEEQQLLESNQLAETYFGRWVAVSGDTVMIKGLNLDVFVYKYNGVSWIEQQTLTIADPPASDSWASLTLNGDIAVVGARGEDCAAGPFCGAAYVFRYNGTSWVEQQKLTASDVDTQDGFGESISVSGDTIVVGAARNGCADGNACGSAYVFRYNGTSWVEQQKLTAFDAAAIDLFGGAVSISGDVVVIGSTDDDCAAGNRCGAAYVYRFNGTSWVLDQKLTESVEGEFNLFGESVSVSGDMIVVGASDACPTVSLCGSAYVYTFNGTSWEEEQKLTAPIINGSNGFGDSVFANLDTVFVGSKEDADCGDIPNAGSCGATFVYNSSGNNSAASSPMVATAPNSNTKDRYLSFDPSTNTGKTTALRVTRVGSTTPSYVSCTMDYVGADGRVGQLVQSPEFCEWTNSVIHIRGCEIVPGNEYLVDATTDGVAFSASVSVFTTAPQIAASRSYGDLVGAFEGGVWKAAEGFVTANDIVAVVQKFQLLSTAPHISRVDNDGQTPNGLIASNDILREVQAFAGSDFGFGVTGCLTGTCVPNCP